MTETPKYIQRHEYDEDACCIHCGFDGAEWHWWKKHTYEGKASEEAKPPLCVPRRIDSALEKASK